MLAEKKYGSTKFCVDYRKLNTITKLDIYPLPRLDDALDRLNGSHYITALDLISGYWQVKLHADDAEKSAFVTPGSLFQFRRLSSGLCNTPATFQRLMDRILGRLKWTMALVYLDDIIVYANSLRRTSTPSRACLRCPVKNSTSSKAIELFLWIRRSDLPLSCRQEE